MVEKWISIVHWPMGRCSSAPRIDQEGKELYVAIPRNTTWSKNYWKINALMRKYIAFYCLSELLGFILPTVKSFVELVKFVFTIPGVKCFLSEKLCQDPLEKLFGCQRQCGGVNENPNVYEFCSNTRALRVVNCICQDVSHGNCRGPKSQPYDVGKECAPLPKWQRKHK